MEDKQTSRLEYEAHAFCQLHRLPIKLTITAKYTSKATLSYNQQK